MRLGQQGGLPNRTAVLNCKTMIPPDVESLLRQRLDAYPAVALIGPRQSGKTTLARSMGGVYSIWSKNRSAYVWTWSGRGLLSNTRW